MKKVKISFGQLALPKFLNRIVSFFFFIVSSKVIVYSLEFRPREKEKGSKVELGLGLGFEFFVKEEKEDDDDDKDEGGDESAYIQCDEKWIKRD